MKTKRILRVIIIVVLISLNIGCDQVTKKIVRQRIGNNEQISFINNHLLLTRVENKGAFLSLGDSLPKTVSEILLIILPLIVLGYGLLYLFRKRNLSWFKILGICLLIGGGFGNIYDRTVYGSVTDFLFINFGLFHTGIFNFADVSLTTGILIVLIENLRDWTKLKHLESA